MTRRDLGERVDVFDHAVERYVERVRPGSESARARSELAHLLRIADFVFEAPEWLAGRARQTAPVYAVVADVVLPLQLGRDRDSLVAVTCLTRGGLSAPARERRNAARVRRRAARDRTRSAQRMKEIR